MKSINRNQPEDTHEDLHGDQAVEQIREVVDKAETCFFCTAVKNGDSKGVRPMNVREVDDEGNLWFLSAEDSHTNKEIALNCSVKLFFQGSAHSDFLYLHGHATISRDKERVRELWE